MRTLHHYSEKGEILYSALQYSDTEGNYPEVAEPLPYVVGDSINSQLYYVHEGELVEKPLMPTPYHDWDWESLSWVFNVEKCRAAAIKRIEQRREDKINSPFNYAGVVLDADAKAQRNISAKITELNQRIALGIPCPPELRVWRDANNTMHTFEDDAAYLAWLVGASIAITARGSQAYAESWQAKDEVNSATELEVINSYVPETIEPFIQLIPFRAA